MSRKILLVDDDRKLLDSLALTLRKFEVETEADPHQALERLRNGDYAVIVSDMLMPGMNGVELLGAAVHEAPTTARVMLTGHGDLDIAMSAINRCRVFRFVTKPVKVDEMREIVMLALEEHERLLGEEQAKAACNLDALTELPNRSLFMDRLKQAVAGAIRNKGKVGVLFLDFDGFKPINDQYGHQAGDRVLVEIGCRLQGRMRGNDTVARYGGDEFVIILPEVSGRAGAATVARELLELVLQPVEWNGGTLAVSASIGVGIFPDDGHTIQAVLTVADSAMYRAKRNGGGAVVLGTED
ncbi:diguanylate cyclase domain-containing protein [Pseudodesulfovibrio tunisiensis]|uniref:diguanylate cyclase domain-containing protein n=1 Tax=Pseudodesulfovibrio tunisiensis TaxID=463192 RepID=UPI001FB2D2E3|nr:diguanylate cyclase [Pseudodesulfovibrio tunisiensis]